MAVVGSAEIVVRAITTGFKDDVKRQLGGLDGIGNDSGDSVGRSFSRGFTRAAGQGLTGLFNVGNFTAEAEAARAQFASLQKASFAVVPAVVALGGVIGSLIGGIGILINTVLAASPVLLGLINIFGAVAVSAGILRQVFKGVGEAISNGNKGVDAAADAADRLADAELRVKDAKYALNELLLDQAANLKALEVARNRAADAEADAAYASERAERNYQDSVKATEDAIEGVTKAREDAKEAIQQLRFELEGGVISEKKARLEFEKARESLQRVQDLPPNSRARREAELAFAEADLNLRRAIDKNGDLRKETARANKEGINGNKNVLAAEAKVVDSKYKQQDAEVAAYKASQALTRAKEELKKAEDDLLPTSERARKEGRARELAERAVTDAIKARDKAQKDLNTASGDPSINLSPSAKEFVDYIISLKERLEELRLKLQENFFEKFTPAVKLLVEVYLPLMEELLPKIATSLGIVAEKFAKVFTDPQIVEAVKKIFEEMSPLIEAIGGAFSNLAGSATLLLAAFAPFATEWAQHVEKLTEGWLETLKNKEATGELEAVMKTAADVMNSLWRSLGNFIGGVANTIKAQFSEGGGGWFFLTWLETVTEKWEQFTKLGSEDGSLDKYLFNLTVNFTKVLTVIGKIIQGTLDIAASEGFGKFMDSIIKATETFNEIGLDIANNALPSVGKFVEKMAELIQIFFDAESIKVYFDTLRVIIEGIILVLDNEFMRAMITGTGLIVAFGLALGTANIAAGFFAKVFVGSITQIDNILLSKLPQGSKIIYELRFAILALQTGVVSLAAPILITVAAIAAIIAIFTLAYQKSEILRESIKDFSEKVLGAFSLAFESVKDAIADVFPNMGKFMDIFKEIGDFLGKYIVPIFTGFISGAIVVLGEAIGLVIRIIGGLFTALTDPVEGAKKIWGAFGTFFTGIVNDIKKLFGPDTFSKAWNGLKDGFKTAVNYIIKGWNAFKIEAKVPSNRITKLLNIDGFGFTLDTPNIPLLMAKGGIVPATSGGMLAMIGEAGRPERVEPLDPDGLSKRDKAMIAMLAGPAGGINITVNPSPGMDERELANLVSRQLAFQMRKGAA
jgi:phage-related minor tail protein